MPPSAEQLNTGCCFNTYHGNGMARQLDVSWGKGYWVDILGVTGMAGMLPDTLTYRMSSSDHLLRRVLHPIFHTYCILLE